ncbi:Phage tail sheath protein [Microbacterium sp. cf046]|uniref:phage tail sheath family protein n=1 Tax=Microbacterium sp. cf046 TaxID=1761803 RepID=UPI0008E9E3CB|nr:phage tail sheath C-terminal domain-containing protein [Microbacterium sp. cf046]SFS03886.1 Phage tail sheath protein [Microbacterium sp. cf046]
MGDEHPGVWIEEVPFEARPIEGVATSIAAFVGSIESGPYDEAYIYSAQEFAQRWPGESALGTAVEEFFRNGGSVARVSSVKKPSRKAVRRAIGHMDHDVTLIAVVADPPAPLDVVAAAADAAASRRAMLLVEGPWADAQSAIAGLSAGPLETGAADPANVAVYWPRVRRTGRGGVVETISPLGPVAGMIARTDATRGVATAPAGTGATLQGVIEPASTATSIEATALNDLGVNVIRALPQFGTVVWGSRTQSRDGEWKYVSIRRLFLFLEESIDRGLGWVVFEPNGMELWQRVRRSVTEFLLEIFRSGAFAGATPDEAFFVKCDQTTMTQNDLDNGRLVCLIGIAPTRPAEFVIFRIGCWTADADV